MGQLKDAISRAGGGQAMRPGVGAGGGGQGMQTPTAKGNPNDWVPINELVGLTVHMLNNPRLPPTVDPRAAWAAAHGGQDPYAPRAPSSTPRITQNLDPNNPNVPGYSPTPNTPAGVGNPTGTYDPRTGGVALPGDLSYLLNPPPGPWPSPPWGGQFPGVTPAQGGGDQSLPLQFGGVAGGPQLSGGKK